MDVSSQFAGDEKELLQSADFAILLTNSTANGGVGGQVDGVDPLRHPGIFRCAWVSKNYKGAFIHEIGHLFGARIEFQHHFFYEDQMFSVYFLQLGDKLHDGERSLSSIIE